MEDKSFWDKQELICDCDAFYSEASSPVGKKKIQALRKDSTEGKMCNSPMKNKGNVSEIDRESFVPDSDQSESVLEPKSSLISEELSWIKAKRVSMPTTENEKMDLKKQTGWENPFSGRTSEARGSISKDIKGLLQKLVTHRRESEVGHTKSASMLSQIQMAKKYFSWKEDLVNELPARNCLQRERSVNVNHNNLGIPEAHSEGSDQVYITMQDI